MKKKKQQQNKQQKKQMVQQQSRQPQQKKPQQNRQVQRGHQTGQQVHAVQRQQAEQIKQPVQQERQQKLQTVQQEKRQKLQNVQQEKQQKLQTVQQEKQQKLQTVQQEKRQKLQPVQQKQQGKQQRQKRDWREYLYNCPYLILITLTSLAVMFVSNEIGISAVVRDAQTFVSRSYAKMPGEQRMVETGSHRILQDDSAGGRQTVPVSGNSDGTGAEGLYVNSDEKTENAGKRKDQKDDLQIDGRLQGGHEDAENGIEPEEIPKGTTIFESYEPVQIESRYYKDAGKVALTTEYPYTKENTSYFDDAAFLGDSRTLGISDYAGLETADFYCDSGMMIFKILEEEVTYQKTGSKVRMTEVLQNRQYGKIYLMLGMNELGYGNTEMYLEQYRQVLEQIREWQPEAIIYIMANLHVSREKNNMETEFNNININDKNAASASLANGTDVFYLDVNPVFTDEEGYLKSELTFDGVHLYAKHYDAWREFLMEHAVEPAKSKEHT